MMSRVASRVAALLVLCLLAVVWLDPGMPSWQQDAAWPVALDQATVDHLAYGRDVIFTLGPWSVVYTGQYLPGIDRFILEGGGLVSLALAAGLGVAARGGRLWATPFVPLVVATVGLHDPVFVILPLLLLRVAVGLAQPAARPGAIPRNALGVTALLLLACSDALLTFVKLTFGTEALPMVGLSVVALQLGRRTGLALLVVASYAASIVGFWLLVGQRLSDLPAYLGSVPLVIAGYNEGAARDGPWTDVAAYLIGAAVLLVGLWRDRARHSEKGAILLLLGSLFTLFVAFKSGFVRHDEHVLIALGTLAILPVVLSGALRFGSLALALSAGCLALAIVSQHYQGYEWPSYRTGRERLMSAAEGAWERVVKPGLLRWQYGSAMAGWRAAFPLPHVTGPTDIYSSGQTILLANRLDWSPRPALQSFTAFSGAVAKADLDHLEGIGRRPPVQNVFFKVESEGYRVPTMEDGLSWPALLTEFHVDGYDSSLDMAVLRRRPGVRASVSDGPIFDSGRHAVGETVPIPPSPTGLAWATLDLRPTLLGRLATFLFRPPILSITIRYATGPAEHYHFLSALGRSGFLLAPRITDTAEMLLLLLPERRAAAYRPVSITITGEAGTWWAWRHAYDLQLRAISIPDQPDLRGILVSKPSPVSVGTASGGPVKRAYACSIDSVDDVSGPAGPVKVGGLVRIGGWTVLSKAPPAVPDHVVLRLTDPTGHSWQASTLRRWRPDVAEALGNAALSGSGFDAIVDLSGLEGPLRLTVEPERGQQRWSCQPSRTLFVEPIDALMR